jgi:hypothetical protein
MSNENADEQDDAIMPRDTSAVHQFADQQACTGAYRNPNQRHEEV